MDDPHDQKLVTGHDNRVCILATSNNNRYLVSGQLGSKKYKDIAPILLCDTTTMTTIQTFEALYTEITQLCFSPDSTKLLGIDVTGKLVLWCVKTGEVIITAKLPDKCLSATWINMTKESNLNDSEFYISCKGNIERWTVSFNLMTNQYQYKTTPMKKGSKEFLLV
eukprot:UN27636